MLGNKDKAATSAEATAQNYNQLNGSYQSCAPASTVKLRIGTLLLALQMPLNRKTICLQYSIKPTLTYC
jgi:hypothetical protein